MSAIPAIFEDTTEDLRQVSLVARNSTTMPLPLDVERNIQTMFDTKANSILNPPKKEEEAVESV